MRTDFGKFHAVVKHNNLRRGIGDLIYIAHGTTQTNSSKRISPCKNDSKF